MTLIHQEAEAALARQLPDARWLLLSGSILERLSGSLCEAVSGQANCGQQLAQLAETETFITLTGDWFYIRPDYADVWRNRLFHTYFDKLSGLHARASQWYESQGEAGEAIRQALAAGEAERAARLILSYGPEQNEAGNFQTVLEWMAALPEAVVRRSARLCLLHARALLQGGYSYPAAGRLSTAQAAPDFGEAERAELAGLSAAVSNSFSRPASG